MFMCTVPGFQHSIAVENKKNKIEIIEIRVKYCFREVAHL
jgi:hypothetical protein